MTEIELERELARLGIPKREARLIALLPLVEVAWADGSIQESERSVIVAVARERFHLGEAGLVRLEQWLAERPPPAVIARGRTVLAALCDGRGVACQDVIPLAREVARAAGGLFGFGAIDEDEAQVIDEVASALGIAPERPWALPDDPTVLHDDADAESEGPLVKVTFHRLLQGREGPVLVHYDPDRGDQVCAVEDLPVTIGRADDNAIQIEYDAQVSRHHLEIAREAGVVVLRDLGTGAGTFVDGTRVTEHRLVDGQTIQVGSTSLFFQDA